MRFIHLADCHIDGYRDAKLASLGFENFIYVINQAIKEQVDFVLIAGDLFNTALPRVDALKDTTLQLKRLQEAGIPVYLIPGSHDYSPHGKTMLDVIEIAGLAINVMKGSIKDNRLQLQFTVDQKTGAHITGIPGRKGMLDKQYYTNLDTSNLVTDKFSIFMFHTTLTELKPKSMELSDDTPISFLPKGFDYYAGGHVHIRKRFSDAQYQNIVYPGPTFPNSFSELEELKVGSYVFYDDSLPEKFEHRQIPSRQVITKTLDVQGSKPEEVYRLIEGFLTQTDIKDAIVLLRIIGKLATGKPQDIDFRTLHRLAYERGVFSFLRNTAKLTSTTFEEVIIHEDSQKEIEEKAIEEHLNQIAVPKGLDERQTIKALLHELAMEQYDGEKKAIFSERIIQAAKTILER